MLASLSGYKMLPTSREIDLPPDYTDADFTGHATMSTTFPAGISMVAVPGTPATVPGTDLSDNPVDVFGTQRVVRWDPTATPAIYRRGAEWGSTDLMRVRPGFGYFLRYDNATVLQIPGSMADPSRSVSIPLGLGWNMIGNPFANPTAFADFRTSTPDGVRPYAFVYNSVTGSYEMISSRPAVHAARSSLQPW